MPGKEYRARERTVKKMSRDGLLEESVGSGKQRRVSQRARNDVSMKNGEISVDAGQIRHPQEPGRKLLYVNTDEVSADADTGKRPEPETSGKKKLRQKRLSGSLAQQEKEALTGGERHGQALPEEEIDQKSRQRTQAGKYRNQEAYEDGYQKRMPVQEPLSEEDTGEEEIDGEKNLISDHSSRMDGVRGHSSALSETSAKTAADFHHDRRKKQVQKYAAEEKRKRQRLMETTPETPSLSDRKDEIADKQKKERLNQEQRKQKRTADTGKQKGSRLSFADEGPEGMMVRGSGMSIGKKMLTGAAGAAALTAHAKVTETEDDNSGVEAAHKAERLMEDSVRRVSGKNLRQNRAMDNVSRRTADNAGHPKLHFGEEPVKTASAAKQEAEKKSVIKKFYQKQRYRRMYANAKKQEKATEQVIKASQSLTTKAAAIVQEMVHRNSKVLIGLGILALFFLLISSALTSCTAVIHGTGSSVVSTTYASTDEEIYKVENAYEQMESDLNNQINGIGNRYPGYENFRYQIDEISHNPYHLISYFTAKYGEFTYEQVKDELEEIFREQYGIQTQGDRTTVMETKTVRVGESLGQVVTSGYCNCPICCGQWSGGPTASGAYPTAKHTIAVDAASPFVPLGTQVVMNGVEYVVEDTGAFARYGVQFDVYYDDHATAQAHGHQTWEAYIADSKGLGTPATRANIIEKLIASKYAVRNKKQITATEAGTKMIALMPDYLKSARMTADWENRLLAMERGQTSMDAFLSDIYAMIGRMLSECEAVPEAERQKFADAKEDTRKEIGKCPVCGNPVYEGKKNFYCGNRECSFALWFENRYLSSMKKKIDKKMAADLLSKGKTHCKDFYSARTGKEFEADLLLEVSPDGKTAFKMEFPKRNKKSK